MFERAFKLPPSVYFSVGIGGNSTIDFKPISLQSEDIVFQTSVSGSHPT